MIKTIAQIAAGTFLAAAVIAGVITLHNQASTAARQGRQLQTMTRDIRAQDKEITAQDKQLSGTQNTVQTLRNVIGTLSTPSDPLSAYTDICQTPETDTRTDITQTYYYPCTNNAQTIPQPGT